MEDLQGIEVEGTLEADAGHGDEVDPKKLEGWIPEREERSRRRILSEALLTKMNSHWHSLKLFFSEAGCCCC